MKNITVAELKILLDQGEAPHLIDVREPDEHKEFNIGGVLMPLGHILSLQTDDIEDLKEEPVLCYCRSGNRSMQAALMLETQGFKNVYNLQGGMNAWQNEIGAS